MSRLTNDQYLRRHLFLKQAWEDFNQLYGVLPVQDQWDVHAYFQPSKGLSEHELLAHRQTITTDQPGLPARATGLSQSMLDVYLAASKAGSIDSPAFRQAITRLAPADVVQRQVIGTGKRQRTISVLGVAKPEPDIAKLSQAFLDLARHMQEERNADL